jgi:RNAse (barnase) inhibitor barstar
MVAFKYPDDNQRLDWHILRDGPLVLYFDRIELEEACGWFLNHAYQAVSFDCMSWKLDDDFHEAISKALAFPDYYGRNLNALDECMCFDLHIPQESGLLLVFHHFDTFNKRFPKTAYHLLDIIANASRQYLLYGERLISFLQSDDKNITFEPVEACPVRIAHWQPIHGN